MVCLDNDRTLSVCHENSWCKASHQNADFLHSSNIDLCWLSFPLMPAKILSPGLKPAKLVLNYASSTIGGWEAYAFLFWCSCMLLQGTPSHWAVNISSALFSGLSFVGFSASAFHCSFCFLKFICVLNPLYALHIRKKPLQNSNLDATEQMGVPYGPNACLSLQTSMSLTGTEWQGLTRWKIPWIKGL